MSSLKIAITGVKCYVVWFISLVYLKFYCHIVELLEYDLDCSEIVAYGFIMWLAKPFQMQDP